MKLETCKCKWCGIDTTNIEDQQCDGCWEMVHRIEMDPTIAKRVLSQMEVPLRICSICGDAGHVLTGAFGGSEDCPECEKRIKILSEMWAKNVFEKEDEVDFQGEQIWYSIALGFALGHGETPNFAHRFAQYLINNHLA